MKWRLVFCIAALSALAWGQPFARKSDLKQEGKAEIPSFEVQNLLSSNSNSVSIPESTLDTIPHLAIGAGFESLLYLVNTGTARAKITVKWFGDNGAPMSVELRGAGGQRFIGFEDELDPLESVALELIGTSEHQTGSARLIYDFNRTTFGAYVVFRDMGESRKNLEATTWAMDRDYRKFLFLHENFGANLTGVAFANTDPSNAVTVTLEFRNRQGQSYGTRQFSVVPNGHKSFVLDWEYPETEDRDGLVVARCSSPTCAAIALRFTAAGPFTTIPVMTSHELDRQ